MEKTTLPDYSFPQKNSIVVQPDSYEDDEYDLKSSDDRGRHRLSIFFTLIFSSVALLALYLWATSYTDPVLRNVCKEPPEFLVHNIQRPAKSLGHVDMGDYIARTVAENADVEFGGRWMPHECLPQHNVIVIIPFMGDNFQLWMLLRHLHPILKRQKLHYQIFVVESQGNSTSAAIGTGQLLDAAAQQAKYKAIKDSNVCLIFHYPSILPATDDEYFGCTAGTVKIFAEDRAGFIIGMFADDFDLIDGFDRKALKPRTLVDDLRTRATFNNLRVESRYMRYHDVDQRFDSGEIASSANDQSAEVILQFERSRRLFTHLAVSNSF